MIDALTKGDVLFSPMIPHTIAYLCQDQHDYATNSRWSHHTVLVGLYEVPEKPANAIDFIKEYLGASVTSDSEKLKATVEEQNKALEAKEKEIAELTAKLAALQPAEE